MNLTKQQAIYEHRKMWFWIADETLKRKEKVIKRDYFLEHIEEYPERPEYDCWCCEFVTDSMDHSKSRSCSVCPVMWSNDKAICCTNHSTVYHKWFHEINYIKAAEFAREMAKLPERE